MRRAHDVVGLVAVVLAVGLVLSLNIIVVAVLYDAITSNESGLSENATQILTGWGGGIIGVLGGYVGHELARRNADDTSATVEDEQPPTP